MEPEANLGAIVRAKGGELIATRSLSPAQCKALRAIADCRTPALGGHRDHCDACGYEHTFWNSCRDRHCPGCGAQARASWLEARSQEVLDVPYFHAVLTIPEILRPLARHAPERIYAILLRSAGQALIDLGHSRLGALLGALTILHTWTQRLEFHPHVHCIVPGGGLSPDGRRWVRLRKLDFLFATQPLSRRFRTLVTQAIRHAFDHGSLTLPPSIPDRTALDLVLAKSWTRDWHTYIKRSFGGPEHVLRYLASYTHRIAISNHRILAFDGERVSFSWNDRNNGNQPKTETLPAIDFLARFVQHVVPRRFVRIRYYGLIANRHRRDNLDNARRLIASPRVPKLPNPRQNFRLCPQCHKGTMVRSQPVSPERPRTWFDSS